MAEKNFAAVIRIRLFRWGECPGLSRCALNVMTCNLKIGRQRSLRPRQKRRQHDHRGRVWSDVAASQGMPEATRNWKEQGKDSPLGPPERAQPC